ncbi:MAG: TolC family protein, partial [Planctomycetota bacterium]
MRRIPACIPVLLALLAGCAGTLETPPILNVPPHPRTAQNPVPVPGPEARPGSLHPDLASVFRLLVDRNPELISLRKDTASAFHMASQADRAPNPSMAMSARAPLEETFRLGGSITLSQKIEIGKRGPRVREAAAEHAVKRAAYRARLTDLALETHQCFLAILHAQGSLALDRENVEVLRSIEALAKSLVEGGAESRDRLLRARVEVGKASLRLRDREKDLAALLRKLESLLDLKTGVVGGVRGTLDGRRILPSREILRTRLREVNPKILLADRRVTAAKRGVDREKAKPLPDVTVSALYSRQIEGGGKDLFGVGVGLPLPLLDANRAAIAASRDRVAAAEEAVRATLQAQTYALEQAASDWEKAHEDARSWADELIPQLEETAALAKKAFEGGRESTLAPLKAHLDLVSARRILIDLRLAREKALAQLEA